MKYYTKKPDILVGFKLDFSTDEKTIETIKNLEHCSHTLIHRYGDRGYTIKLEDTTKEFSHGDYICTHIYDNKWFGCDGQNFEAAWEERK